MAVFNAPYSNTRSVVELAIGLTIVLMRDVADKSAAMHRGEWNKSATGSRELRGKTLGIVGYGAIGSQLSDVSYTHLVHLGPTEFRLLDHLMKHPGRVFSREQLLDAVWGSDVYVEARTVDVHVGRLRKALNVEGTVNPIRTVRSAGYSLDLNS